MNFKLKFESSLVNIYLIIKEFSMWITLKDFEDQRAYEHGQIVLFYVMCIFSEEGLLLSLHSQRNP